MTGSWASRVADNVFPLSIEQNNLRKALKEWKDTAGVIDFSENDDDEKVEEYPSCELCGHPHIKTGYIIENTLTGHTLVVGCECIKKFQPEFEIKKVNYNHVIDCLNTLKPKIGNEKGMSLIKYYAENKAFTPKQLVWVLKMLKRNNVPYTAACFKMKIRRDREKLQLKRLTDDEIALVSKCLTPSQEKNLELIRG